MSLLEGFGNFCSTVTSALFPTYNTVVIGMGSNLGDREKIMNEALAELKKRGRDFQVSSLWETDPWDDFSTEKFLNAVVIFKTILHPHILLSTLQKIEDKFGRTRTPGLQWQNRTLDLDILFYGEQVIETKNFHVPHQYFSHRAFAIIPLAEIAPNFWVFHLQKTAQELCAGLSEHDKKSVRFFSSFTR
ncbi:MAG: 2-amino-4-hydroxy-6-hydroxymethyldihydropteridine diphosphokinase [Candidatus Peregrinibacteria bacterium]